VAEVPATTGAPDLPAPVADVPSRGLGPLPRRTAALISVDPFGVLDLMTRHLPGLSEVSARLSGVQALARPGNGGPLHTRQEAARRSGMDGDDVARLWRALGFAEPAEGQPSYTTEDVRVMSEVARLADDGAVDLDLLIGMVRPMGHLVSRLGAAQVSALAGVPQDPPSGEGAGLRRSGATDTDRLVPLLERLVVHAWRRHVLTAASSVAMPLHGLDAGTRARAVGFVDIAGYTTLSRRIGWVELGALLEQFEACVFDQVATSGGRVVKTLGDEVLFVAADAATGAEITLGVLDATRADPHLPPVHGGLAWGPLLDRAGDVFGPTVNLASRVADLARSGTVLVDSAFGERLRTDRRYCLERRPRRPVRGYPYLATLRLTRARGRRRLDREPAGLPDPEGCRP